ncbi:MAG: DUF5615 family PIN-like protein [Burkholderiales bacterium]
MIRILLDQGLPRLAASILRESGWDVVHVGEVNLGAATDAEILEYARVDNRVCVTLDADFHTLLMLGGKSRPSTIRIRVEGLKSDGMASLLKHVWPQIAVSLEKGALVTINEHSMRIRHL